MTKINIIGAGLAGCEAAWQLASRGFEVEIFEFRNENRKTFAHRTQNCAELVCSNSLRSDDPTTAIGLLHEEMRLLNSLIMRAADANKIPAGSALAVDREGFSKFIEEKLLATKLVKITRKEIEQLPVDSNEPWIIATGPLTSDSLSKSILQHTNQQHLAFFDAIAPIIFKDSIDFSKAWFQSRYDKGSGKDYINCPLNQEQYLELVEDLRASEKTEFKDWEKSVPNSNFKNQNLISEPELTSGEMITKENQIQRELNSKEYWEKSTPYRSSEKPDLPSEFLGSQICEKVSVARSTCLEANLDNDKITEKDGFAETPYFDGCLPVEVMAARGEEVLRFGPLKPVGLTNPHFPKSPEGTPLRQRPEKPYAVVQLRQDNALGTIYNMVGFQTKMKYGDQQRVFRKIPGLENAEFARFGGIHRNTYINSPLLLDDFLRFKKLPHLRFAGQITGVEGYVESAAIGLMTGILTAKEINFTNEFEGDLEAKNAALRKILPSNETAIGALLTHITTFCGDEETQRKDFQPMNVNFGLFGELNQKVNKQNRKEAYSNRALEQIKKLTKILS